MMLGCSFESLLTRSAVSLYLPCCSAQMTRFEGATRPKQSGLRVLMLWLLFMKTTLGVPMCAAAVSRLHEDGPTKGTFSGVFPAMTYPHVHILSMSIVGVSCAQRRYIPAFGIDAATTIRAMACNRFISITPVPVRDWAC